MLLKQVKDTPRLLVIIALVTLSAPTVRAEDPARGRLPDGRAFRTDVNGNEIVDYIAELELAVETMTRKVHGLEDELEERNATIARLRSAGATESTLKERTLVGSATSKPVVKPEFAEHKEEITTSPSCESELAAQKKDSMQRFASCQEQLNILEAKLKRASVSQASISSKPQAAQKVSSEEKLPEEEKRASLARKTQPSEPTATENAAALQLRQSDARDRALEMMKGTTRTALNKLKGKIASRGKLYAKHSKSGKSGVSFTLRKAISATGRDVSQLEKGIKAATSSRELSGINRDIRQITGMVNDDIALMKRLGRVGR